MLQVKAELKTVEYVYISENDWKRTVCKLETHRVHDEELETCNEQRSSNFREAFLLSCEMFCRDVVVNVCKYKKNILCYFIILI